jgi:hypothetical protein
VCPLSRVCPGSPRCACLLACEVKDTLGAGTPKALSHELMTVFFTPLCAQAKRRLLVVFSSPQASRPARACMH